MKQKHTATNKKDWFLRKVKQVYQKQLSLENAEIKCISGVSIKYKRKRMLIAYSIG